MEKELKDYLDQNFSKLATKEEVSRVRDDLNGLKAEMVVLEDRVLHQYHITAEALRDDIKQVAEGVINLNEKFDREISQFRKEVAYSHEELKSMIKFSYSELDRRLTALEVELESLKHRVEKIERSSSAS
jgi:predicted  nucleic acid-binding Zn-ribbon protein